MSIYYPPGAANDPRAPYNEKEPTYKECPDCEGSGQIKLIDGDGEWFEECAACKGEGKVIDDDDEIPW